MPVQPDGIFVEYYEYPKIRAYWSWIHPLRSNDGTDAEVFRGYFYHKYGHPAEAPPDAVIEAYLNLLLWAYSKNWERLKGVLEAHKFLRMYRDGWVLDMYAGGPNYVLTSEGPKTIEFLQRVIEHWAPIDERIAEKAKEVLALYVAQRL